MLPLHYNGTMLMHCQWIGYSSRHKSAALCRRKSLICFTLVMNQIINEYLLRKTWVHCLDFNFQCNITSQDLLITTLDGYSPFGNSESGNLSAEQQLFDLRNIPFLNRGSHKNEFWLSPSKIQYQARSNSNQNFIAMCTMTIWTYIFSFNWD